VEVDISGVMEAREQIKYWVKIKGEEDVEKLEKVALEGIMKESDKHLKIEKIQRLLKTMKRYGISIERSSEEL